MFDCKPPSAATTRLQGKGNIAILNDKENKGLYTTIAETLWNEGLRADCGREAQAAYRAYCEGLESQEAQKEARPREKKAR
jgi:hypothetical protein